jgi:hypothetical protein
VRIAGDHELEERCLGALFGGQSHLKAGPVRTEVAAEDRERVRECASRLCSEPHQADRFDAAAGSKTPSEIGACQSLTIP